MIFPSRKYKSINEFYDDYVSILNNFLKQVDRNSLVKVSNLILKALKKNSKIFICGNGGSAAIANHFLADYGKYIKTNSDLKPKIISLSSNIEIITAISNDISFDKIFHIN
jgi:phosphoheptose isomerase